MHGGAQPGERRGIAARLRRLWSRRGPMLLRLAVAVMLSGAAVRSFKGFRRLVLGLGLGDVPRIFIELISRWFAGLPVYSYSIMAVHPPATYAMLWPFFGWLEDTPARLLWAALSLAAIAWLVVLTVREGGGEGRRERAFLALLPLCMYAMMLTLTNGQLGVFLLPLLIAALLLLDRRPPGWGRDLGAAALLLAALVKPPVAAPFFWIALFLPGGLRPVLLAAAAYAALTLFALSFQPDDFMTLLQDWQARSSELALTEGSANLHRLLSKLGLGGWILPASLLALAAHGWWVYRHRRLDPWLLMGVTAVVARFWTYHRQYDDILILLPAIALYRRAAKGPRDGGDVWAALLLAAAVAGSLSPVRLLRGPRFWQSGLTIGLAMVWVSLLIFLLWQARRENPRAPDLAFEEKKPAA